MVQLVMKRVHRGSSCDERGFHRSQIHRQFTNRSPVSGHPRTGNPRRGAPVSPPMSEHIDSTSSNDQLNPTSDPDVIYEKRRDAEQPLKPSRRPHSCVCQAAVIAAVSLFCLWVLAGPSPRSPAEEQAKALLRR